MYWSEVLLDTVALDVYPDVADEEVDVGKVIVATLLLAAEEYNPAGAVTVAPLTVRSADVRVVPVGTETSTDA